ncbi:SARP family transcriptional regulator [Longimycelium tulufanense]|uniref:SARP family transcriptional regulator n=1 Tax=Longimycelium tulufanense TaxID=907463 RepID=A0A8J3FTU6_9PSEU|nr:SARP family transcriptional regulator [Longimycelium tulufanense]
MVEDRGTTSGPDGLELRLLGPVEVLVDGRPAALGGPGVRALLGLLLLATNRVVPVDRVIDVLWGDSPPTSARTIVHNYVHRLRRLLSSFDPGNRARIDTQGGGYVLVVDSHRVDLHRARELMAAASGAPLARRAELLRAALGLWRGPVLVDLPPQVRARIGLDVVEEVWLGAVEDRIQADLDLGEHASLATELRPLVAEHPYRERLVGQLMLALHRSGRRADALVVYQELRRRVVEAQGIDPGPELLDLYQRMLRDDPTLRVADPDAVRGSDGVLPRPAPVPAQLPLAPGGFTGRADELTALDNLLADRGRAGAPALGVLTGTAGAGKTALALAWAHAVAHEFPDGRLFASLRGFDPVNPPRGPGDVLARLLSALGVPAAGQPVDVDERAALYRSLLADRRVLVLLDDASDTEQVRPLLAGGGESLVLVTSRRRLDGLVVRHAARVLVVGELPPDTAVELVDVAAGAPRSRAEPDAVRELVELCGRLPLALRIAAARLASHPGRPAAELVAELADERRRLTGLDVPDGGVGVRGAFDVSYRNLTAEQAATFRLLGLHPGPAATVTAVAAMAGSDVGTVRSNLRALAAAHLVTEPEPDRFGAHDLLRLHARDLARHELTVGKRATALRRMIDYQLAACDRMRRLIRPVRDDLDFTGCVPAELLPTPTDPQQAVAWFDTEWPNLLALSRFLDEGAYLADVWQLARLLLNVLPIRSGWEDWTTLFQRGLRAARQLGDRSAEGMMLVGLGVAHDYFGQSEGALEHYTRAHDIAVELDDPRGAAVAAANLGSALLSLGRNAEAKERITSAIAFFRGLKDLHAEANQLQNLALCEQRMGRGATAVGHLRRSLELYQQTQDDDAVGRALANLAEVLLALGRVDEAEEHYRRALRLALDYRMLVSEAFARLGLGDVHHARREFEQCRTEWDKARELFERCGSAHAKEARDRLVRLGLDDPDDTPEPAGTCGV